MRRKHLKSADQTIRTRRRRGFTLVELIVVIAIVTLLMGILIPALRGVRATGRMTVEMSAARQLMIAWTTYAADSRDRVLPGYRRDLLAFDASGRLIGEDILADFRGPAARGRYPWRLAPYLSYTFRGLYLNEQQDLLEKYEQDDPAMYTYLVSLFPSLGLNTVWVGGDEDWGAFDPANLATYGTYYVMSTSHVRTPARLLVFASARGAEDPFDPGAHEGYFRVRSPYLRDVDGYLWADGFHPANRPDEFGFLSPRYEGKVVTAFADGHVAPVYAERLTDMRMWANGADREDWTLTPR